MWRQDAKERQDARKRGGKEEFSAPLALFPLGVLALLGVSAHA
jgi:hypothetical protein